MYWTLDDSRPRERRVLKPGAQLTGQDKKRDATKAEEEKKNPLWVPVDWLRLRKACQVTMAKFPEALEALVAALKLARDGGEIVVEPSG